MNIQHSSRHDSWRTPAHIVEMAREVLGSIDLDPCTDEGANVIVRATHIFTRETDGLSNHWPSGASVWINPPGGKSNGKSNVRLWWRKLMRYRALGELQHAIFAMFSVEGLQTTQGDYPAAMDFPVCVPAKRVHWVHPTEAKSAPSHSNAFIYVPGTIDRTDEFVRVFGELGRCKR